MEREEFNDKLKSLGKRVAQLKESINTEEATKTSLIMPFFQILGYDIFNPMEFIPEYTADVGIKKGEKVDYAISLDGNIVILVEAKSISEKLEKHDSQLFRYFGTTSAKFAILTNGEEYKFFTDLEQPNKMDATPFLTINMSKLKDAQITEVLKFHKDNFDVNKITSIASELKYISRLKEYLSEQLMNPSDDFTKFIVSQIFEGMKTKQVIDKFKPLISKGFNQYINDMVNDKLSSALNTSISTKNDTENSKEHSELEEIVTTDEELAAYTITKLILKDTVDIDRIYYRDNRSYFNIILDDNIRKWILRLYKNKSRTWIVLNDGSSTEIDINDPTDIALHSKEICQIIENL